jgi:hypothetical protein
MVLGISATLFGANASAAPITFIHTGSGSGSIGGTPFGNSSFTITGLGDTANRQSFSNGYFIDHDSVMIDIQGVGTLNLVTGTRTFFNDDGNTPGFSRAGSAGADLFNGPSTTLLDGWDMLSSIGPFGGNLELMQWDFGNVITDGGILLFNHGISTGTFEAVVVPEPGTFALFGAGLLCFTFDARRLRRKACV